MVGTYETVRTVTKDYRVTEYVCEVCVSHYERYSEAVACEQRHRMDKVLNGRNWVRIHGRYVNVRDRHGCMAKGVRFFRRTDKKACGEPLYDVIDLCHNHKGTTITMREYVDIVPWEDEKGVADFMFDPKRMTTAQVQKVVRNYVASQTRERRQWI